MPRRQTNGGGEVRRTMEDNLMRTAIEMRRYFNGVGVEVRDNGYCRQRKAVDRHGGVYVGQQGWIRWRRRCGMATKDMWDNRYGKMGRKDGNGLVKY